MRKIFSRTATRKHILQFSPPRSGSTLVYNILREVFPHHQIEKCHTLVGRNLASPIVATYRNPVDSVASLLMCEDIAVTDSAIRNKALLLNREGIWDLLSIRQLPNLLLLRYEDFVEDYGALFDAIERFFETSIPAEQRQSIEKKYNQEAVQAITNQFADFSRYDAATQFHGRHISPFKGAPNCGNQLFSAEQASRVACYFSFFMEEMGYDMDPYASGFTSLLKTRERQ